MPNKQILFKVDKVNFPHEAIIGILEILEYGSTKHTPGTWRNESYMHHIEKAHGHIHDFFYGIERGEDHLLCALTRMAMAISVRDKDKYIKKENL